MLHRLARSARKLTHRPSNYERKKPKKPNSIKRVVDVKKLLKRRSWMLERGCWKKLRGGLPLQ
jgi:hypothetical protein